MHSVPMLAPPGNQGVHRRSTARLFLVAFVFSGVTSALPAQAADDETLVKEAKKLLAAKKYDEACPKFAEAYKQSSNVATLVDLALCHEKQGKIATAWSELLDAEAEARKAGRSDVETRARANGRALEPKLPRIKMTVANPPPGLEVTIDGQKIDTNAQGKGRPVDPGEHKIVASAPGRKSWKTTVTLKQGQTKAVTIPALAEDPKGPDKSEAKPADMTNPAKTTSVAQDISTGRAKRIVVEAGAFVGGQLFLGGGSLPDLSSLTYEYKALDESGFDAAELGVCSATLCRTITDPAFGVPLGAQVFVGYAVKETMHVGGRVFGSWSPTGGYAVYGGPSLSMKVSEKLWVGGALVLGFGAQNASITGARGTVPSEWVDKNGGDEVKVLLGNRFPKEGNVGFGFSFGASAEVSYRLAEFGRGKSLKTGSLLVSAWPMFMKTWGGAVISLPVGVSYRFH